MKIVLSVHHYPPTFVGGVELVAERLARMLVARGHRVEVVCVETVATAGAGALTVRSEWQRGVLVHRLGLSLTDDPDPLSVRFRDAAIDEWCTAYYRRTAPDLIHSLSSYVLSASAIEAARRLGIPTIAGLDDYWYFCPQMTFLRSNSQRCLDSAAPADCAWCVMGNGRRYRVLDKLFDRLGFDGTAGEATAAPREWFVDRALAERIATRQQYLHGILAQADAIVTPAPLVRDLLLTRAELAPKVTLIEHGLEAPAWQVPARPTGGALRIGYLGQVWPAKGVHVLVEAFRKLDAGAASAELLIHGDLSRFPKYAAKLRRLAAKDTRIQFRGAYQPAELGRILSEIDLLVFPSNWFEILGLVILEALQAGVPVLVSRLPNHIYQVREEIDGLAFEPDNAVDLARQLQRCLDDPTLIPRLASNIAPVRTFAQELDELESVYKTVVVARPGGTQTRSGRVQDSLLAL